MKPSLPVLILSALLTVCTLPLSASALDIGSVDSNTQAPLLAAGQQWTYRRIDLWKNEEVERFSQTFNLQNGHKWTVAWGILSSSDAARLGTTTEQFDADTHGFADARMKGVYAPLRFPLMPGKTWSFQYQFQSKPDTLVAVNQTALVEHWESVTVPAGTFKALRVSHSGRYRTTQGAQSWGGRITETFWYAPEVGRVVAQEYRDTNGAGKTWDQRRDELVSMRR